MTYKNTKKTLLQLMNDDYSEFIKALFCIETSINDNEKLNDLYDNFMSSNHSTFIDEDLLK